MGQIDQFLEYVKSKIDTGFGELKNRYSEPENLYLPAWDFILAGGKRLRPAVVFLASQTAGTDENALFPAMAVELLHNFTLIHDDIMDKSEFRRQVPTVYKKYGINQAILSGDVLMILAFEILDNLPLPQKAVISHELAMAARIVCEGQQYDVDTDWRQASMNEYLRIVERKTAALLKHSARIGVFACLPNAYEIAESLGEAMFNAGIAFQITDDYIDLFSNKSGKTPGLDIKEKKATAIIVAINQQGPDARHRLWTYINDFRRGNLPLEGLISEMKKYKIDKQVLAMANKYFHKALNSITNVRIPEEKKYLWVELIERLVRRVV